MSMVETIARAVGDERDRWSCIHGGDMDDVIVRDDDSGDPQEVSRHPAGDGEMYFYDMVNRACATAALRAMETPTEAMIDRFVSRALQVSVGGGYTWSDYARDQWKAMIAGAFDGSRER